MSKKTKKSKKTETINANRLAENDIIKFGGNDYLVLSAESSFIDRSTTTTVYATGFKTLVPGERKSVADPDVLHLAVPHATPFTVLK